MGTRSSIALLKGNGTVESIYIHWDGYPSHNGAILLEHYTDTNKIRALLALGDLSSLGKNLNPGRRNHSYDKPADNVVVSYRRDRGEADVDSLTHKSLVAFLAWAKNSDAEYAYVFDEYNNTWYYANLCCQWPNVLHKLGRKRCELPPLPIAPGTVLTASYVNLDPINRPTPPQVDNKDVVSDLARQLVDLRDTLNNKLNTISATLLKLKV
jgi:hypothetical protein